jgi:hypothetical protein
MDGMIRRPGDGGDAIATVELGMNLSHPERGYLPPGLEDAGSIGAGG